MKTGIFAADLFKDKVKLVTGAAGGVGGATADLLVTLGARLALTDCNANVVQKAAELGAVPISADLAKVSDCERAVETTIEHYGRLDSLINCAGVWVEGDSSQAGEADWDRCIDINLKGTFFMCSRAIPALKASRGAIVNISSDAGVVGNAGAAIMAASDFKAFSLPLTPPTSRPNCWW